MRALFLLLTLAAGAAGEDVQLKVDPDLPVAELVSILHRSLGVTYLYAPGDLAGRTVGGKYDIAVPEERAAEAADFLVRQAGFRLEVYPALRVLVPKSATESRFRASGLEAEIDFDRGPGSWRRAADAEGSLSESTVEALLAEAAKDRPAALDVLAVAGPRTPSVVKAVGALLGQPQVRARAAALLEEYGFLARPALPALREAGKADPALEAVAKAIEAARHPALLDPALATGTAPQRYVVRFETTAGDFEAEVTRDWAPRAADRFWNLVRIGFFDGCRFFRVMPGFVAQFGKSGDPEVNKHWWNATFKDEPVKESNKRGYLSFAKGGPDSRATQVFLNLRDNPDLDGQGFPAFGRVIKGMEVVDRLCSEYGEKPDQGQIHFKGEDYLRQFFPKLDKIKSLTIVE
ncbi:MAG TPA: peptidylprolyl isomerase [Planctomycetota bacterium]|nr:peptidylprolyl isomerase [Planctomycetota bacterium]